MKDLLARLGHLCIYIFFCGIIPALIILSVAALGFLVDGYAHTGVAGFASLLMAFPLGMAVGLRLQESFLKKFPQYNNSAQ